MWAAVYQLRKDHGRLACGYWLSSDLLFLPPSLTNFHPGPRRRIAGRKGFDARLLDKVERRNGILPWHSARRPPRAFEGAGSRSGLRRYPGLAAATGHRLLHWCTGRGSPSQLSRIRLAAFASVPCFGLLVRRAARSTGPLHPNRHISNVQMDHCEQHPQSSLMPVKSSAR
jgi:hypothetical protein